MVLSDRDIKKSIKEKGLVFNPKLSSDQIGPASIDLKLSNIFKVFHIERHSLLDIKKGLPKDFIKTTPPTTRIIQRLAEEITTEVKPELFTFIFWQEDTAVNVRVISKDKIAISAMAQKLKASNLTPETVSVK